MFVQVICLEMNDNDRRNARRARDRENERGVVNVAS